MHERIINVDFKTKNRNKFKNYMKNIGIALIVIGLIMTLVTGFNFVTREKVVDIGSVEITSRKNNPVQWSPIIGGVLLVTGIIVMVANKNKN